MNGKHVPFLGTRTLTAALLGAAWLVGACTSRPADSAVTSDNAAAVQPAPPQEGYRVVTVVEGLDHPWSMAFMPNGDMLVTERSGQLRVVRGGQLQREPISGVPPVHARGQGGLLDVVLHPNFAQNRLVYLSFSK